MPDQIDDTATILRPENRTLEVPEESPSDRLENAQTISSNIEASPSAGRSPDSGVLELVPYPTDGMPVESDLDELDDMGNLEQSDDFDGDPEVTDECETAVGQPEKATPDVADEPKRASIMRRMTSWLRGNWRWLTACGLCSIASGLAIWLASPEIPTPAPPIDENAIALRHQASAARRGEPIAPLAPLPPTEDKVVDLGNRLFHEPGLSGNGRYSCASCHHRPTDAKPSKSIRAATEGPIPEDQRIFPLQNLVYNISFYRDGRADTLEAQLDESVQSPAEMGSSWDRIVKFLETDPEYVQLFDLAFQEKPSESRAKQALLAYEKSLIAMDAPFDQWLRGDEGAISIDVFAGYQLFKRFDCITCHHGPNVGGNRFASFTTADNHHSEQSRPAGSDSRTFVSTDRKPVGTEKDEAVWRVAPLRQAASAGPYFHDGSAKTLEEAVRHMLQHQVGKQANAEQIRRIVSFLNSLQPD